MNNTNVTIEKKKGQRWQIFINLVNKIDCRLGYCFINVLKFNSTREIKGTAGFEFSFSF